VKGKTAITSASTAVGQKGLGRGKRGLLAILRLGMSMLMILPLLVFSTSPWAAADEASGHLSKFLEIPLKGGSIPNKLRFPLHEQNNIQYFSAGLGKEERSLSYPPYPLKLIFVKGERAFLATVAIEVLHHDRTALIAIPAEEVQGPWLFLNLPAGQYVVQATDSSGTTIEKSLKLVGDKTTTVHFRWP